MGKQGMISIGVMGHLQQKRDPAPTPKPYDLNVPPLRAESHVATVDHFETHGLTITRRQTYARTRERGEQRVAKERVCRTTREG
jgi:hypothetical protein